MNLEGAYGLFIYVDDPGRVHHSVLGSKAARHPGARRSEDDLRPLRGAQVFGRLAPEASSSNWFDRDHADPGTDPVGAETRIHGHGSVAAPDVDRRSVPEVPSRTSTSTALPDRSMMFNRRPARLVVVFFGGAVEDLHVSPTSATWPSFIPVLIGYYLLRKHRPKSAAGRSSCRSG